MTPDGLTTTSYLTLGSVRDRTRILARRYLTTA
jgi:hypothetical protein